MNAALSWSPEAIEDLMDIYGMIGVDNLDAAERWYSRIEVRPDTHIGHVDTVEIISIVHGNRELSGSFRKT